MVQKELNHEDVQLVKLAQEGNKDAFGFLVKKYRLRMYSLVHRYIPNSNDCSDIVQEIFISSFRSIYQFRYESTFYTWLYRIGANTCLNYIKNNKSLNFNLVSQDYSEFIINNLAIADTPEQLLAYTEKGEALLSKIRSLPERLRETIILRELDGLTYAEIADTLSCPIGTVRSRLFRARAAIN